MLKTQQHARHNLRVLGLRIALSLAIVGGLSGYWSFAMSGTSSVLRWWGNWFQDVGTEMLGAAVTILLVELVIYQKRDEASRFDQTRRRRREHLTDQLKRARTLEKRQKLLDRMRQQDLLAEAWMYDIDLHDVVLDECNLAEADLYETNLVKASLQDTNLQNAMLRRANLSQAVLISANLEGADLVEANLEGADLYQANLKEADLDQAKFSVKTRLPDGTYWMPDMDLDVFVEHLEQAA
jgi:hypothetical protein